jgi:hypothetical protein
MASNKWCVAGDYIAARIAGLRAAFGWVSGE